MDLEDEYYDHPFKDPNQVAAAPAPTNQLQDFVRTPPPTTQTNPSLRPASAVLQERPTVPIASHRTGISTPNPGAEPYSASDLSADADAHLADELCLANACGNCALAIGQPLYCVLWGAEVDPLSSCRGYISPYEVLNNNS